MVPKPIKITPKEEQGDASTPRPLSVPPVSERSAQAGVPAPIRVTTQAETRTGPAPTATGGGRREPRNEKLERLIQSAQRLDAVTAANARLRPRLDMLLQTKPDDWMNWSAKNVARVSEATNEHVAISNALRTLDPSKWTEECERAVSEQPKLLDRIVGGDKPDFYKTHLTRIRGELQAMASRTRALRESIRPDLETLCIDALALQVASENLTESIQLAIAQNRLRTLVSSEQAGLILIQALEATEATIVMAVGNIDHLVVDVIPQWQIAAGMLRPK